MSRINQDEIIQKLADELYRGYQGIKEQVAPQMVGGVGVGGGLIGKLLSKGLSEKTLQALIGKGLLKSVVTRLGTGAAAGSVAPGFGNLIGLVLGAIWTAYDLYKFFTTETLTALIEDLEALDVKTWSEALTLSDPKDTVLASTLEQWGADLREFEKALQPGTPPTNPEQTTQYVNERLYVLKEYLKYLQNMSAQWFSSIGGFKTRVKDVGGALGDIGDFENSLKTAITEVQENLRSIEGAVKAGYQEVAQTAPQTTQPISKRQDQEKGKLNVANRDVVIIQKALNRLNQSINPDKFPALVVDGDYGPKTASALTSLMSTFPSVDKSVQQITGLSRDYLNNTQNVKSSQEALSSMAKYLSNIAEYIKTQQKDQTIDLKEDESYPSDETIIANLKRKYYGFEGTNQSAYNYLKSKGLDEPTMITYIKRLFPNRPPRRWSMAAVEDYVKNYKQYTGE